MIFETLWESAIKGELILVDNGLCHYHERRDGQVTIREIIVLPMHLRRGVGTKMLNMVRKRCPFATSVFAKVPADLDANGWYEKQGFKLEGQEEALSGRKINLWRLKLTKTLL
jgi:ribosomal protein S18 acetylase RimI-like enzyme